MWQYLLFFQLIKNNLSKIENEIIFCHENKLVTGDKRELERIYNSYWYRGKKSVIDRLKFKVRADKIKHASDKTWNFLQMQRI